MNDSQHAKQFHFLGPTPNADRMMHLSVPSVLLQEAMEQKISLRNETEKKTYLLAVGVTKNILRTFFVLDVFKN